MVGIQDLIYITQNYSWLMIVLLWLGAPYAYKSIGDDIEEIDNKIEGVGVNQVELSEQVNRLDQKQENLSARQKEMLSRLGMNREEIQELKRETARLDERSENRDDRRFYRGDGDDGDD
jgi:peptidoglycan hydrolase CwlO-like protein